MGIFYAQVNDMNIIYAFIQRLFNKDRRIDNVEKFRHLIKLSLKEIEGTSPACSEDTLLKCLQAKGIPKSTGKLILENLSSAFCKKLLSEIKYMPNDPSVNMEALHDLLNNRLSEEKINVVEEEMEAYCLENPKSSLIVNLASRSLEYSTINRL